jgi:hypothetical protein
VAPHGWAVIREGSLDMILLGTSLSIVGLIAALFGIDLSRRARRFVNWPRTQAKVTWASPATQIEDLDASNPTLRWWTVEHTFSYQVGRGWISAEVYNQTVSERFPSLEEAEQFRLRTVGRFLQIQYDPEDPYKISLRPKDPRRGRVLTILGASVIAAGLALVLVGL